jgi:hypothetical protein
LLQDSGKKDVANLCRHDLPVFIVIDQLILAAHCPHDIGNANTLHNSTSAGILTRFVGPIPLYPPNVLYINEYFATF